MWGATAYFQTAAKAAALNSSASSITSAMLASIRVSDEGRGDATLCSQREQGLYSLCNKMAVVGHGVAYYYQKASLVKTVRTSRLIIISVKPNNVPAGI